jgi:AraC-like DNA-binding protein
MERRGSATELARSDGDGWYAAPGIVVWRVDGIDGSTFWGHVTIAQLDAAFERVRHYASGGVTRPIDVVSDLAAMTSVDVAVYPRMAELAAELLPRVTAPIRRHVVIVPDGMIGATAAGFLHLHTEHRWQIAADLGSAVGEPLAARVAAVVEPAREADLVTALRARLAGGTLPAAAKALGVTPRSLQRSLRGAGTSFRAVVDEHRIAEACRLLDQTDLKVESIAREVGFRSLSGFVRSFRRAVGCSPHERRLRQSA